jgi:hydrogenase expression/formation protein HypE
MIAVVPADEADAALAAMHVSRYGEQAAIIGEVSALDGEHNTIAQAYVRTAFGSRRILDMLTGEQLPRIC